MYDDYNVRRSNMIEVANVVFEQADLPLDINLDGEFLTTQQVIDLLDSKDTVVMSTAYIEKDTLNHLNEMLDELTSRYLYSGALEGYSTIKHSVVLNSDRTKLLIVSLVD